MRFPAQKSKKKGKKYSLPGIMRGKGIAVALCEDMKRLKASATIEALMILPVAFSFAMVIIWLIRIFGIHSEIGAILGDVGASYVENSYVYFAIDKEGEGKDGLSNICGNIITEGDLIMRIKKSYAYNFVDDLYCGVTAAGVGGYVDMWADYMVQPPVKIPGYKGMRLHNRYYSKQFTGYIPECCDEEIVYVTKGSEVYHTHLNCTALKTTVNEVPASSLNKKRSKNGSKYYACDKCVKGKTSGNVYITPHGNRYHTRSDCPELKLNIYKIPLSEAGGKRKCFYCE